MRIGLSKKTRFDVFKRDGFTCQYCGSHPPAVILEVDHIKAVVSGGGNGMDNLVTSCFPCNRGKSSNALSSIPTTLKDKAIALKEMEKQIRGYNRLVESVEARKDSEVFNIFEILCQGRPPSVRKDWFRSVRHFIEIIGFAECEIAADLAICKGLLNEDSIFRYFCGVCWKRSRGETRG